MGKEKYTKCSNREMIPNTYQGFRSKPWKQGYRKPEAWWKNEGTSNEEYIIVEYFPERKDWTVWHYPSGDILTTEKEKFMGVHHAKQAANEANEGISREYRVWWG
jgi:hypothetical protein